MKKQSVNSGAKRAARRPRLRHGAVQPTDQLSYEELQDMLAALLNDSTTIDSIRQQFNASSGGDSLQQASRVWVEGLPADIDSAEELAKFLETQLKKDGAVARCRLQCTAPDSEQRMGTAIVQFKSDKDAWLAIDLARERKLVFKGSQIRVYPSNNKKAARRRCKNTNSLTAINKAILHIGCLTKNDELHRLWTYRDSKIEVDNTKKVFSIIIRTSSSTVYKLDWRFRDLYEFCRCKIRARHTITGQTFMLRVWYTPQIFEEYSINANQYVCKDLVGFSSDDLYDPVWVRSTDFTPRASIGQSFVYCLEVAQQHSGLLDYLIHTVLEFSLKEKNLMMENGCSYSTSLLTVPILNSPYMDGLPFELVFLINSLVQLGHLSGPSLGWSFFHLLSPSRVMPLKYIVHVLEKLRREKDTCFEPELWFHMEVHKFLQQSQKQKLTNSFLDDGLMMVRRVYVTPSRVYCMGPEVDMSNRVTRHFNDHIDDFIRVTFVEDDFDLLPASALVASRMRGLQSERNKVYHRIISVLTNGITIGGKKFEFLAFSTSQLRENSVWMFSSNESVTAADIRLWMGDFLEIRNVAKCASRMGQSFSSSTKSLDVPMNEIESIEDVWNADGTYCFSDGIGKISASFATEVAGKCSKRKHHGRIPSSYQIRYGGYKGVVAVDPTSPHKLSLRPTMRKFQSSRISLDILNTSRMLPSYLNREIISLLSTLGVPDSVFETLQEKFMQHLDAMLKNGEVAMDAIQAFSGGSDSHQMIIDMLSAGFRPASEPFLMRMLHIFRAFQLMSLRKKTRIYVPKGRLLMGCLDETRTLDYGQAFICVSPTVGFHDTIHDGLQVSTVTGINNVPQSVCIVEGPVIVAKNPCVHPGDVRVLTAIDVPALHHMVDCIVFPQKGHRSHPSECSGSDLDGDLYFVSWDTILIPPEVDPPQDYQPAPEKKLDRQVTTQDIIQYFAEYMVNDSLGKIANAHVVFADMLPEMARHTKCLELARLCSIAVDFPKTGVAAVLPADLRPATYPDFMEKTEKPQYVSERILGKLFRAVMETGMDEEISFFTKREATECYDKQMEFDGFKNYREAAVALKKCYDEKLLYLMYQYGVKSEAEIVTGNILSLSKWFHRRPGDVKEKMMRAVGALRKEARKWLKDLDQNASSDDDSPTDEGWPGSYKQLQKASAWYHVTYHPSYVPDHVDENYGHLLSFPWVAYKQLIFIKKREAQLS